MRPLTIASVIEFVRESICSSHRINSLSRSHTSFGINMRIMRTGYLSIVTEKRIKQNYLSGKSKTNGITTYTITILYYSFYLHKILSNSGVKSIDNRIPSKPIPNLPKIMESVNFCTLYFYSPTHTLLILPGFFMSS